jgi:hypothetical protein
MTTEEMRDCQQQHSDYYRSESREYQILCECIRVLIWEPLDVARVCHHAAAGVAFYQFDHSAHRVPIKRERRTQANILREVVGDPFRESRIVL